MRAAKAAKDVQSAANELTDRLSKLVTDEVEGFTSGIGCQLTFETQQSYTEYLTGKAVPLISQLMRLILCDQQEEPATTVLMHLAGQACSPSLFSEIKAAFPKVPLPPGKPSESPRRGKSRLSINEVVEVVRDESYAAPSPSPSPIPSPYADTGETGEPQSSPSESPVSSRNPRKKVTSEMGSAHLKLAPPPSTEEILEHLRKVDGLNEYAQQDLERVADICEIRTYEQEEAIISTGAPADELHFLLSGTADLCVHQTVRTMRNGEFLGVEAIQQAKTLILKNPNSLVAGANVRTLCIPRGKFQELDLVLRKSLKAKREGMKAGKALARGAALLSGLKAKGGKDVPTGHCSVTGLKTLLNYEKTEVDRQMMAKALQGNKVLSEVLGLTTEQCETTVDSMHMVEVPNGAEVFKKGDIGNALFIVHAGMLKVDLGSIEVVLRLGDVFGELSLLYDEPRSATIFATRDCRLWVLPRAAFKEMLQETTQHKMKEHTMMLHNVPGIRSVIDMALMAVLAGSVEETVLYEGELVCAKGEDTGKLFVIQSGFCSIIDSDGDYEGKTGLMKGDWVGEKQLIEDIAADRTVQVTSDKATVLMVDNYHFELAVTASQDPTCIKEAKQMTGNAQELSAWLRRRSTVARGGMSKSIKDLTVVGALGEGSFGQVPLVRGKDSQKEYALKRVSRKHLEQEKQENMVRNERGVMMHLDSPFVVKLWGSYQDSNAVYFLLQAALGGELFDIYSEQDFWGQADKARFYIAGVALGLSHLHSKHVIWRDLKLENCLMDEKGYLKITDFGISKMVTGKTYTVCGTADYFAPETLKQVGHNRAADWWALGIMLFIMIAGYSPFDAPEVTQIYKNIIKGLSKVQFPPAFTKEAEECVRALCRKKPEDRIVMQRGGLNNLAELSFFSSLDWEELEEQKFPAPYIPPKADYEKIAQRQLSSKPHIDFDDLDPWDFEDSDDEDKRNSFTGGSSSGRPSVVGDAPAVATVTGNAAKWQEENFDDYGLCGI